MDILEALEGLDSRTLRETDEVRRAGRKRRGTFVRWAALAACLTVVMGVTALTLPKLIADSGAPGRPDVGPDPDNAGIGDTQNPPETPAEPATSDKYSSLPELLAYLSRHDNHGGSDRQGYKGESLGASQVDSGAKALAWGGYVYYVSDSALYVSPVTGGPGQAVEQESQVQLLFLVEGQGSPKLVAVGSEPFEPGPVDGTLDATSWTLAQIMDLTDPASPVVTETIRQRGALEAAMLDDSGKFVTLVTAGGQCACGWSDITGQEGFVPETVVDGQELQRGEEDILILGEPTRVSWAAVTTFAPGGETRSRVLYGNIHTIHYGPGFLAAECGYETSNETELYFFTRGEDVRYRGRLTREELGDARFLSVSARDGRWLAVGEMGKGLAAWTYDPEEGAARVTYGLEDFSGPMLVDVVWESDRALLTVETAGNAADDRPGDARILTLELADLSFSDTGLSLEQVNGIDGVFWSSNPMGQLSAFIPLGGGRYLRYDGTPHSFDLISIGEDSASVEAAGLGELPQGSRCCFTWQLYGDGTLGVLTVAPGENGRFNRALWTWRVYRVDAQAGTMELAGAYDLGTASAFGSIHEPLEIDGHRYVVASGGPVSVE